MKKQLTLKIAQISILAGLSFVLYLVKLPFHLPFFPQFLEIQFSNLPAIIGGFALGPLEGALIIVIRFFLKLPMSETIIVGEIADLIIGLATVLTSALIYKRYHTKKGGYWGLFFGAIAWVVVAILANWLFLLDFYVGLYFNGRIVGENGEPGLLDFLQMIPGINETNYMQKYLLWAILPFNLLLASLVSIITALVYKRISSFFLHGKAHCKTKNHEE